MNHIVHFAYKGCVAKLRYFYTFKLALFQSYGCIFKTLPKCPPQEGLPLLSPLSSLPDVTFFGRLVFLEE